MFFLIPVAITIVIATAAGLGWRRCDRFRQCGGGAPDAGVAGGALGLGAVAAVEMPIRVDLALEEERSAVAGDVELESMIDSGCALNMKGAGLACHEQGPVEASTVLLDLAQGECGVMDRCFGGHYPGVVTGEGAVHRERAGRCGGLRVCVPGRCLLGCSVDRGTQDERQDYDQGQSCQSAMHIPWPLLAGFCL